MADIIDVKKKLNSLVKKSKPTAEGFSYICQLDGYQCVGRKTIIEYLKEKHEDTYNDLKAGFEDETEFRSQLSKMVMTVPYSNEDVKPAETKPKTLDKQLDDEEIVEEKQNKKNLPLTLDYMRNIDGRTTKIPNYGSLVGRIARLLALVLRREKSSEGEIKIFSVKTDESVGGCQDIHGYLESTHPTFLENLVAMFPPAKKRMDQFLQRAAENFDLTVPTWQQVERLQREESDRIAAARKKEMEEKLQKAKQARAENEKKRKVELEQRLAVKRKQEENQKLREFKQMKINPGTERAEEILKIKKEIQRIEIAMKGKHVKEEQKSKYKEKLTEQRESLKTILDSSREKRINKRLSDCLENLSPKQLRKLCMEYLNNIDCVAEVNWVSMCQNVKIDDDFEYLADFLGSLYEMAKFHGKKGFKVGHVLVTSKQSEAIVERGIRSVRDNISEAFIIPSSWDVDSPEEDLGQNWNRKADSRLLRGASRFGKNLLKIVNSDSVLSLLSLDSNGAVKAAVRKRFGHLINVYITRGQPAEEFGTSLYSIDREEDEEDDHHLDEEEGEDEVEEVKEVKEMKEVTEDSGNIENKENQDNNGVQEEKQEASQDEEKELVNLEDEEDLDPDEEIDEKLLDDSD